MSTSSSKSQFAIYQELTKPRILIMQLVTVTIGYFLGGQGITSYLVLLSLLLGTGCVSAGAAMLNNYLEKDIDCLMDRTRNRALPNGLIAPARVLYHGILFVLCGLGVIIWQVNLLTAFIALLTTFLYVLVYTPMKRLSWLNTSVGAIPGALPPLGGWAAATGQLDPGAWVLFFILFAWQHPHFYAIAWMYREDYQKAGFKMLPLFDPQGIKTTLHILFFSFFLLNVSLLPAKLGMSGPIYFFGVFLLGCILIAVGIHFSLSKSRIAAKQLLKATVYYLPLLLILIVADANF